MRLQEPSSSLSHSFVVIAHNEKRTIHRCVESVLAAAVQGDEILLVDSFSTDGTSEILQSYADNDAACRFLSSKVRGPAAARNEGLHVATGDLIFFVDGDIELAPEFLQALDREMGMHRDVVAVAGILSEKIYNSHFEICIENRECRYGRLTRRAETRFGGVFAARRNAVKKTGIWDSSLRCHEDTDYAIRLARHGLLIAIPVHMGVHHTRSYESRAAQMIKFGYFTGTGLLLRKYLIVPHVFLRLLLSFHTFYAAYATGILVLTAYWFPVLLICIPFLIAVDMFNSLRKKKAFWSNLLFHYVAPLQALGAFVLPKAFTQRVYRYI